MVVGQAERGQQYSTDIGPVKGTWQEEMIPGGLNVQEEHPECLNNTLNIMYNIFDFLHFQARNKMYEAL